MKNQNPEPSGNCFSRPLNVTKLKSKGLREHITANQEERSKLAEQLAIDAVDVLSFKCVLMPWKKGGVELTGQLTATIKETCVVTLEVFATEVLQDVKRYFDSPRRTETEPPLLDLESIDDNVPDIIENGMLDIGDIAIETLALVLSPHPRKPDAVFIDHVESNPDSPDDPAKENPFDVLQQLKKH